MTTEEIGEEEDFQHHKNDEEFDQNNGPKRLPQRHATEAIVIEMERTVPETLLGHKLLVLLLAKI
jgi:hypothetical protein